MNHRLYACRTFVLITTLISFLLEMLCVQSQLTQGQLNLNYDNSAEPKV